MVLGVVRRDGPHSTNRAADTKDALDQTLGEHIVEAVIENRGHTKRKGIDFHHVQRYGRRKHENR